jgi:putative ABC transport system permease protein
MLAAYIKFATRNIIRTKTFSAINILGLVVSLTAFILMTLYIEFEFSYDKFHTNAQNIYRVVDDKQTNALLQHGAGSAAPVGPAMQAEFPQIKQMVRIIRTESLVRNTNAIYQEKSVFFADASFFSVFDFPMTRGEAKTALAEPNSVVLTAQTAKKYFGDANPIGKTLSLNNVNMKVTGITANVPTNSHFSYDLLISMATAQTPGSGYDWMFKNWYSNDFYTYILLPDNFNTATITSQLASFAARHQKTGSTTFHHYAFEKLTNIYLFSDRDNQAGPTGNIRSLYIFSIIAAFILIIACINFVNLSTARAAERAKEIGIKKATGVTRSQLVFQFFTESFLIALIAIAIALFVSGAVLPAFNTFTGKAITLSVFSPVHFLGLLAIVATVGLLAGAYPALVLSAFNPVKALKGTLRSSGSSIAIRKGLVVFQFVISIILIVSSLVVYSQLRFMQHHDLGFKPSQTMVINFEGDDNVKKQYASIKQELLSIPGVKSVSASSNVPGDLNSGGWSMDFAKRVGDTVHAEFPVYLVDFNFLKQFNIPMVAGRAFSEQYAADTTESMLINETALAKLGITDPDDAIGIKVMMYPAAGKVIGVYRDFHFESLQKAIQPLAMRVLPGQFGLFSLQINTSNLPQTIAEVQRVWKKMAPDRPLQYTFLDEDFNKQYIADIKFGQMFAVFTGLAITIACFGLFGLALFSVKQRTKEIGIRKVVGASVVHIIGLLSGEFVVLVVVALLIATPVSFYFMDKWIQGFAYRIALSWWIFLTGGVIAVVVAITTVSYQAIRAALANPVKSLRSE